MNKRLLLFGGDFTAKIADYIESYGKNRDISGSYMRLHELNLEDVELFYNIDEIVILRDAIITEDDLSNLKGLTQTVLLLSDLDIRVIFVGYPNNSIKNLGLNDSAFKLIDIKENKLTGDILLSILNDKYIKKVVEPETKEGFSFKFKERQVKQNTSNSNGIGGFFKGFKSKNNEPKTEYKTFRPKVVSFIGGANGVGTTYTAMNTALSLVERGFKVLLLEYSADSGHLYPWIQVPSEEKERYSVKRMYDLVEAGDLANLSDTFIDVKEHLTNVGVGELYTEGLYLSSSNFSLFEDNIDISKSNILFTHLIYHEEFDFILLDIDRNLRGDQEDVINLYLNASERILLLNQDISIYFDLLDYKKYEQILKNTNHRVLNKYSELNQQATKLIEKYYLKNKIKYKLPYIDEIYDHIAKVRFTYLESSKVESVGEYNEVIEELCDSLEN